MHMLLLVSSWQDYPNATEERRSSGTDYQMLVPFSLKATTQFRLQIAQLLWVEIVLCRHLMR